MVITLTMIMTLVSLGLALNKKAGQFVETVTLTRDKAILLGMAESGVNIAMAMLIKDGMDGGTDTLCDIWAMPEYMAALVTQIPFEKGTLSVKVTDEQSRIQANALVKFPEGRRPVSDQMRLWRRFLRNYLEGRDQRSPEFERTDDFEKTEAINQFLYSAIDWLDSGDDDAVSGTEISSYGAESEFYQGLDPPYECGNGPFSFPDELTLVKGHDFFAPPETIEESAETIEESAETVEDGSGEAAKEKKFLDLEGGADDSGFGPNSSILDHMTIHGISKSKNRFGYKGKININTAGLPVLLAMFSKENEDVARSLYDLRQEEVERRRTLAAFLKGDDMESGYTLRSGNIDLKKKDWHTSAAGWGSLTAGEKKFFNAIATTSSDIFKVESTARLNGLTYTAVAIVRRKDANTKNCSCHVLNIYFK